MKNTKVVWFAIGFVAGGYLMKRLPIKLPGM